MADKIARTVVWKGLNRAPYIADGEMRNMKNLSSDAYPYITTRRGRVPYKVQTYIPGVPGNGYIADVENLPEACMEEEGNIYRVNPTEEKSFIPGEFYYISNGEWIKGIKDEMFKGITEKAIATVGGRTLLSTEYCVHEFEGMRYVYDNYNLFQGNEFYQLQYAEDEVSTVKYLGEDSDAFKKGKTYMYKIKVEAYWKEVASGATELVDALPTPTLYQAFMNTRYMLRSNRTVWNCCLRGRGCWEEVEDFYEPVTEMPENPNEGKQVRFVKLIYGSPLNAAFYISTEDIYEGVSMYFYTSAQSTDGASVVTYLPEASAENIGKVYRYAGVDYDGGFSECVRLESGEYKWKTVSHPQVSKVVTVGEWIKMHGGAIKEIIEIAAFRGEIAVLYMTDSGAIQLYYNEKTYNITNCTMEPGKKLSVVGNRLIVGESGNYLHIKDGITTFIGSGSEFSVTVLGSYATYGNGGEKCKSSSISGNASNGQAQFVLWSQSTENSENEAYKAVKEGLAKKGTNFSVTFNGKTYYLTSESVTYGKRVFQWAVGSHTHYDYGECLEIAATGVKEDFLWNNHENGFSLELTFASTDPHYYDVTAWKKRLWGYDKNVVHGTASDIFASSGNVDWVKGDNTYLEAISQPIWQGGNITGLAALSDALILFKEDSLTVFTGNYPAIMSASTIPCRGLCAENRESVAVGNEAVFYLSQDGVYKFTGGIPQSISRGIKIKGTEAVGASDGNKYWLSLREEDGNYALYVYDAILGIWHKEDNTRASSFTMLGGEMYMADVDTNEVYNICAQQEDVEWEAELWFDEGTYKLKKYKKLTFRGNTGECEVFIKADDGEWQAVNKACGSLEIVLEPFCCEELTIRLRGKGICEIKSLERQFEVIE